MLKKINTRGDLIKKGDTLAGIAKRNGTIVGELQKLNGIKNLNRIIAGKILKLRGSIFEAKQKPEVKEQKLVYLYDK